MTYTDNKGNRLEKGARYLLITTDHNGGELPTEQWIDAKWDGSKLISEDGCTWNEWLGDPQDIIKQ